MSLAKNSIVFLILFLSSSFIAHARLSECPLECFIRGNQINLNCKTHQFLSIQQLKTLFGSCSNRVTLSNLRIVLTQDELKKNPLKEMDFSKADFNSVNFASKKEPVTRDSRPKKFQKRLTLDLTGVNFSGARLIWAFGRNAFDLSKANFDNAKLIHFDLPVKLCNASFKNATLLRSEFYVLGDCVEGKGKDKKTYGNMYKANFDGANLRFVRFFKAGLQKASFKNATLNSVSFRGADLTGANFEGAKLSGVSFKGAVLKDVKGLEAQ